MSTIQTRNAPRGRSPLRSDAKDTMTVPAANGLLMSLTTEAREKLTARSVQVKLPVKTPLFEAEKARE